MLSNNPFEAKSFTQKILSALTEEQVLKILELNKLTPVRQQADTMWFITRCHGGDSEKLCLFRHSLDFYCYTNCGRMNLIQLISQLRNCTYGEAAMYIARLLHIRDNQKGVGGKVEDSKLAIEMDSVLDFRKLRDSRKQKTQFSYTPIPTISDFPLKFFEDNVFYEGWYNEGITIESMKKFGIEWYEARKHIIIPHVNYKGQLVGIRRRTLIPEEAERGKYMPETFLQTTYAHSLGLNLYGLYQNKEAIKRFKTVVIAEGEKSVLLSDSFFGSDSVTVATCGFNISNWQRDILLKMGVRTVYLAFDKDFDSTKYVDKSGLLFKKEDDPETLKYIRYVRKIESLASKFFGFAMVKVLWDEPNTEQIRGILDHSAQKNFLAGSKPYFFASDYDEPTEEEKKAELDMYEPKLQEKDSPFDRGRENFLYLLNNAIPVTQKEEF